MSTEQKLSQQWGVFNHISSMTQAADNKAAILLAIVGIIASFLFSSAFEFAGNPDYLTLTNTLGRTATLILFIGVATLCFSTACAFLCLLARIGTDDWITKLLESRIDRSGTTIVFFGGIAKLKRDDFVQAVENADEVQFLTDLTVQTYVLSCIAAKKYLWLNKAYLGLAVSLISFLFLAIVTLF